jgi:hypothetical protein
MGTTTKTGALSLALGCLLVSGIAAADDGLGQALGAIAADAAKVDAAAGAPRADAKKALLDDVSGAVAAAKSADEVAKIINAAVTADPNDAADIAAAAITASPSQGAVIASLAEAAAPSQAAAITAAAVSAGVNPADIVIPKGGTSSGSGQSAPQHVGGGTASPS